MNQQLGRSKLSPSPVKFHQEAWHRGLSERFGRTCVQEWSSFARGVDQYSPRLDLAVGPFSETDGERLGARYEALAQEHRAFLQQIWDYHLSNERSLNAATPQAITDLDVARCGNYNPRCFLAIEIENAVSRKHLMGGIMNAVALGHLGILIGWTDDKVRALFRARAYLHFLEQVDKPTLLVRNLVILGRDQADQIFGPVPPLPNDS